MPPQQNQDGAASPAGRHRTDHSPDPVCKRLAGSGLKDQLIGVVSHWPEFLDTARTMLAAAGVDPDLLVLRDTHRPRWRRGLDQTAAIICDVLTANTRSLPRGPRLFVYSLLADAARTELERLAANAASEKL